LTHVQRLSRSVELDSGLIKSTIYSTNLKLFVTKAKEGLSFKFESDLLETFKLIEKFPKFQNFKTTMNISTTPSWPRLEAIDTTDASSQESSKVVDSEGSLSESELIIEVNCEVLKNSAQSEPGNCVKEIVANQGEPRVEDLLVALKQLESKDSSVKKSTITKYCESVASAIIKRTKDSKVLFFFPNLSSVFNVEASLFKKLMNEQPDRPSFK